MISFLKFLDVPWEQARGYLREDLEHLEAVLNSWKTRVEAMIAGGDSLVLVTAVGAVDGTNSDYSTPVPYVPGSLKVYLNGLRQMQGGDYHETSTTTFTMVDAPYPGDVLLVEYRV